MSNDLTSPRGAAAAPSSTPAPRRPLPRWLREPLLHFAIAGAALFAVDHWIVGASDDPRTIVVGAEVDDKARELFRGSRGRDPDAKELAALRQVWVDNEVLYREGLALQVDRGDDAIRERVIFKALSVVDANLKPPAADEKTLRAWFEAHRAKYDEPPRFDFQEAVLAGEAGESAVRALVERLNHGTPGEVEAGLRVFKGRPQASLVPSYGEDFAAALAEATPGEWRALRAQDGWRAIRVDGASPGRPAQFEALQGVLLQDWTDAVMAERRTAAVRELARKYHVRIEETAR